MRGRPPAFDRDEALDSAMRTFWELGYEPASLAILTERMGISPPSLYGAFGDKRRLYEEAAQRYIRLFGKFTAEALHAPGTCREKIARMLNCTAQEYTRSDVPRGCFVISSAINCRDDTVTEVMRRQRIASEGAIRQVLADGQADGSFPADADAGAYAKFLAVVIQGMSVQSRDGSSREALEDVARIALQSWPQEGTDGQ